MDFKLEGTIHRIGQTQKKTEKFYVRTFSIVFYDKMYPVYVEFQLTNDRCDLIEKFGIGQQVLVYFDVRGREWQDKVFNSLQCWRIEATGAEQYVGEHQDEPAPISPPPPAPKQAAAAAVAQQPIVAWEDDLPF